MKILVGILTALTLINIGFTVISTMAMLGAMQQVSNDNVEMLKGYNDGIKEYMTKTFVAKQ